MAIGNWQLATGNWQKGIGNMLSYLKPPAFLKMNIMAFLMALLFSQTMQAQTPTLIIKGPRSTCNTVNIYTINNYLSSATYTITVTSPNSANPVSSISAVNSLGEFQITWNSSFFGNATISITQNSPFVVTTIDVYSCCNPEPTPTGTFNLNDVKASAIQNGNGFTITNVGGFSTVTYNAAAGTTLYINGVLTVDVDLLVLNGPGTVFMGEGALIDMVSTNISAEIVVNGATLMAGCNRFWKGIAIHNKGIKVINSGTIRDAEYAINSIDGVVKTELGAQFINNYISVYAPAATISPFINNTSYSTCNNTIFNSVMPMQTPYYNQSTTVGTRSYAGIELNDVPNFNVDPANANNLPLQFNNLNKGIVLNRTNATIVNCRFTNIIADAAYGGNLTNGAAIYSKGSNTSTIANVSVNIPTAINTYAFNNCDIGIFAGAETNLTATNNRLISQNKMAIYVTNCQRRTISINNNFFTNFYTGIYWDNATNVIGNIANNEFTSNYFVNNGTTIPLFLSTQNSTAITILSTNGAVKQLNILGNTINATRVGIYMNTFNGTTNQPRISSNTYNCSLAPAGFALQGNHFGIWLENFKGGLIDNNTISYTPSVSLGVNDFYGINLSNTGTNTANNAPTTLNSNSVTRTGTAVRLVGMCDGSRFTCNNFNNCTQGVFFNMASLLNQGSTNQPWGNTWTNFGTNFRTAGVFIGLGLTWYHTGGVSSPIPTSLGFSLTPVLVTGNYNNICNQQIIGDNPSDAANMNAIIADTITYPFYEEATRYKANEYVYRKLNADSLLKVSNEAYLNYYDSAKQTNLGTFTQIDEALLTEEYRIALTLLDAINPDNNLESYKKQVLGILINQNLIENYELTETDIETLTTIAYSTSWEAGSAAHLARVLLGLQVYDVALGLRIGQTTAAAVPTTLESTFFTVFPNPSNGIIQLLNTDLTNDTELNVTLVNTLGVTVFTYNGKQGALDLNVPTGMYLLKVSTATNTFTKRICIN